MLHLLQLVPCIMPSVLRKLSEALQRVSEEAQRFHGSIIPIWIYDDKPRRIWSRGIKGAYCQGPLTSTAPHSREG